MGTNIIPKQALQYKPKGRRNIGRPRKRWRDQLHLDNDNDDEELWMIVEYDQILQECKIMKGDIF